MVAQPPGHLGRAACIKPARDSMSANPTDFIGRAVVLAFASDSGEPLPEALSRLDPARTIQEIEFQGEPVIVISGDANMARAYGIRRRPAVVFVDSTGSVRWNSTAPESDATRGLSRRDFIGAACAVSLAAALLGRTAFAATSTESVASEK